MQEEQQFTEDSLLQALSRMGESNAKSLRKRGNDINNDSRGNDVKSRAVNRQSSLPSGRRRRFVGENSVVVEHHALKRGAQKRYATTAASSENEEELERLRNVLRREQRSLRDTEAENQELLNRVKAADTRVAHFRLQLDEKANDVKALQEENLRIKAELHRFREQVASRRQYTRNLQNKRQKIVPVEEQQPVQWWVD